MVQGRPRYTACATIYKISTTVVDFIFTCTMLHKFTKSEGPHALSKLYNITKLKFIIPISDESAWLRDID